MRIVWNGCCVIPFCRKRDSQHMKSWLVQKAWPCQLMKACRLTEKDWQFSFLVNPKRERNAMKKFQCLKYMISREKHYSVTVLRQQWQYMDMVHVHIYINIWILWVIDCYALLTNRSTKGWEVHCTISISSYSNWCKQNVHVWTHVYMSMDIVLPSTHSLFQVPI